MKKKSASALAFFNTRVLTAHRKQSATRPCRMPALLGALLCAAGLLAPGKTFPKALKPDPAGIMDLPGSISADDPIGTLDDHPWQNPNVDGLRIRTGWNNSELSDEVYDWVQIDESLANAAASRKFIGPGGDWWHQYPAVAFGRCHFHRRWNHKRCGHAYLSHC